MKRLLTVAILLLAVATARPAAAATHRNQFSNSTDPTARAATPTITSNQPDYHPGEIVTLKGTGWAPNEVVTIVMSVVPATHEPVTLFSKSDARGNFENSEYVVQSSDHNVKFYVKATGATADTSPVLTFTDAIGTPTSIGTRSISGNATTTTTIAVSAAVPVNNTVIVTLVCQDTTPTITMTDSGGNTYTSNANVTDGSNRSVVFSAPVTTALTTSSTITLHFTPSTSYISAIAFQVSGLILVSNVDQTATASGTVAAMSVGPTPTTTQAGELLFGAFGVYPKNSTVFTAGTGYTALASDISTLAIYPEYRIVSATGAYSATGTMGTPGNPNDWSAAIVTYQAAASQLAFSTTPVTVVAGACSSVITVTAQDNNGNAAPPISTETIALSTSGVGGTFYSTAGCTGVITSTTIGTAATSASFYWSDTTAGSPVITATGTGAFSSAPTQTETVTAPTPDTITAVTAGAQTPSPVTAGSSATYAISTTWAGVQACTSNALSINWTAPAGATAAFAPTTVTNSATTSVLTITTTGATPAATTPFTVTASTTTAGGCGTSSVTSASNSLVVNAVAPTFTKAFAPSSIPVGGSPTLTFTVVNNSTSSSLTGVTFSDPLPTGVQVFTTPGASTSACGSPTFSPTSGATTISFSGGTIAASATCTASVTVTGTTSGAKANTTSTVTSTNAVTGTAATATLTVVAPPTVGKAFSPTSIAPGGTSTLTITITNPSATVILTGVGITDNLPAGMTASGFATTCVGGSTASSTSTSVVMSGASIATSGSCTVTATVTSSTTGASVNTTNAVTSTNGGTGTTATATLTVNTATTIAKAFAPTSVATGTNSVLTITITNPAGNAALTGLAVSDTFPAGLVVASTPGLTNSCNGSVTGATSGSGTISLTGGTMTAGSSTCAIGVNVNSATAGSYANTTGAVTATNAPASSTASATLSVFAPPTMTKGFSPNPIPSGGPTTLTLTITNPATNSGAMNGIAVSDTFPTGMTVASLPNLSNLCGGTTTGGTAGASSVGLTGGSINTPGSTCTLSVSVTSTTAGNNTNTTGAVSSTNDGTGTTANAVLDVIAPPTITKVFGAGAAGMPVNGTSTMTITITNPAANNVALAGVAVSDTFPAGMTISTAATTTCPGGTLTGGGVGSGSISLSGAAIGTSSNCTITASVTDSSAGTATNTTGNVSSTNGGTGLTASANLLVNNPPTVTKTFSPTSVGTGVNSLMTITVTNPASNTVSLSGVAISDTLPSGLVISTPNGGSDTGCTGATFTDTAGTGVVSITGATVTTSTPCVIKVNVQSSTANTYVNTTGTVSSTNGGTGLTASATLTVTPIATITTVGVGSETPGSVGPGSSATYAITTTWTGPGACTSAPVSINWTAPAGATAAFSPTTVSNSSTSTTLTISTTGSTPIGSTNFTVTVASTGGTGQCGTGSVTSSTATFVVATATINGANVGSQTPNPVPQGSSATYPITSQWSGTGLGCVSNALIINWTPPSADTTAVFNPTTVSSGSTTSTLTITTFSDTPPSTTTFNVTVSNNTGNGCSSNNSVLTNTAALVVSGNAPPAITKSFAPTNIAPNATSTLTLVISASAADLTSLTNVSVSDPFPSGMKVASTPGATNVCTSGSTAGTFSASAGATTIGLTGATLASGGSCTLTVNVTASASGTYVNATGNVTAGNVSQAGNSATATLTVFGAPTQLAFGVQPSSTTVSSAITPAITVQVEDASGNVVTTSSASITMAISTNPGNGSLSGTLTQSASSGIATFANLAINRIANGYILTATSTGLTNGVSNAFNILQPTDNYTEPFLTGHGWTYTQLTCSGGTCSSNAAVSSGTDCQVTPCVSATASSGAFNTAQTQTGYFHNPSGYTWQTLGVPAGSIVNSVVGSWWDLVTSSGAGCDSATDTTAGMHIYNSANTTEITSPALFPDTGVITDVEGATHTGTSVNVTAAFAPSTTAITLRFDINPSVAAQLFNAPTCVVYGDSYNLVITYSPSTGGRKGQVIVAFLRTPDGGFKMVKSSPFAMSTQDHTDR